MNRGAELRMIQAGPVLRMPLPLDVAGADLDAARDRFTAADHTDEMAFGEAERCFLNALARYSELLCTITGQDAGDIVRRLS